MTGPCSHLKEEGKETEVKTGISWGEMVPIEKVSQLRFSKKHRIRTIESIAFRHSGVQELDFKMYLAHKSKFPE
jgi:hypothetical protein